jgi:hypothetical protein
MKKLISSLGILAVLALTACGSSVASSSATQTPVPPASSAQQTAPPTLAADKSPRGNTIKKIGDTSEFKGSDNDPAMGTFAVTKIEDLTCTQPYAPKPTNGKLIGLTIDLETKPELAQQTPPQVFLSSMSFKYIADNGTTFNGNLATGASFMCLPADQIIASSFGPAEKAHGIMVLDVPSSGGVLTIGKVEWKLP